MKGVKRVSNRVYAVHSVRKDHGLGRLDWTDGGVVVALVSLVSV